MLGLRPNLYDRMLFEHYFEHSSKWTNLLFQLLNSPSVKNKYWRCGQSTYRIWFCSDNFHGSYQVWAYFINNSSRLSLTSDINLDIDVLLATNELFKMLLRVWMHGENTELPRSFSFPIRVSCETTLRAKEWGWENCLHVPSFPKGHVWICPFMSQTVILGLLSTNFQLENKSLHLPWIRIYTAYVLESSLNRGLFLWMVQHKSRFRNLRQVDSTTQEFVSGGFRVSKFQNCLL